MIEKLTALRILELCRNHPVPPNAAAYCLGDQIPCFSERWAVGARNLVQNEPDWLKPARYLSTAGMTMTTEAFFQLCGFASYTDIDYNGKARLTLDWGKSLPEDMYESADFLYDGGVVEHIPNVYGAIVNSMLLLKPGGRYVQQVPVNTYGESYYCLDPLLLRDFYGANGFVMDCCYMWACKDWKLRAVNWFRRFATPDMIRFWQGKNSELKRRQGHSWIQNILNADKLSDVVIIDPFAPGESKKIAVRGLPPRTMVDYIGVKRQRIFPGNINTPCQEVYPTAIKPGMQKGLLAVKTPCNTEVAENITK